MGDLRRHVAARVATFHGRDPGLSRSTLTLDGAGVNSGVHYLVLLELGLQALARLERVNIISGSIYPFLCLLAREVGALSWRLEDMSAWDRANRAWHKVSARRSLLHFARHGWGRRPLFPNEYLRGILRHTTAPEFATRPIASLPPNVRVWLHDVERGEPVAVSSAGPFADQSLEALVACAAAVPALYGPGELGGRRFIDPVFSPTFGALRKQLRAEAKNHLFSNMIIDRVEDRIIYLKPHEFGDGRRVILGDFARFVLNRANPRIERVHQDAFDGR